MIAYSNPRMQATINDWPVGFTNRGTATFAIETKPGKGQRGTRYISDLQTGKRDAIKALTYAEQVRIVDGDDGKTYFIEHRLSLYPFIMVKRGDMKLQEEVITPSDSRYESVLALFKEVK